MTIHIPLALHANRGQVITLYSTNNASLMNKVVEMVNRVVQMVNWVVKMVKRVVQMVNRMV